MPDPEKFSEPQSGEKNFWPSRGVREHLPRKIFKIKARIG